MKPPMPLASERRAKLAREMAIWGRVPVLSEQRMVPVKALSATQYSVDATRIAEFERTMREPPPIQVARIGTRYVIVDGHHRATLAVREKASHILAIVASPTGSVSEP